MASNIDKSGYDVEFVDSGPNDATCSICLFVLKEPMQAKQCGHRFCKSCIEDRRDSQNGTIVCPKDNSVISVFHDKGKEREILSCSIKCPNYRGGCKWKSKLQELNNHIVECRSRIEKSNPSSKRITLQDVEGHAVSAAEKYLDKANKKITSQSEEIRSLGTVIAYQSKEINTVRQSVTTLKNRLRRLEANPTVPANPTVHAFSDTHLWEIWQFNRKLQRTRRDSDPEIRKFFTSKGYKMKIIAYLNGTEEYWNESVSLCIGLDYDGPFDDTLKWPMEAIISCSVVVNGQESHKSQFDTRKLPNYYRDTFRRRRSEDYDNDDDDEDSDYYEDDYEPYCYPNFLSLHRIHHYVVNNTIVFKINVAHY